MIKYIKWIIYGALIFVVGGLILQLGRDKVDTIKMSNGIVHFIYMDKKFYEN